jgi:ATP-dependent Clp protease protease subunit
MIHQPMSGMQGQVSDLEISLKETLEVKKDLYQINRSIKDGNKARENL